MNKIILDGLERAKTAYHACDYAAEILQNNGFTRLYEGERLEVQRGGKYFITRGGSSLIAFTIGNLDYYAYKIVASHMDSPALKLKYNPVTSVSGVKKLNVEVYGGAILSTFLDVPLSIAGRITVKKGDGISVKNYLDPNTYVIPNVAIHLNRNINDGYVYNKQTDLSPVLGLDVPGDYFEKLGDEGEEVIGYDLYAVNATKPFIAGADGSLICSAGIDNRVCAFASVAALIDSNYDGVSVIYLADNEEIGSRTAEGADSDFLKKTLKRINKSLGYDRADFDGAIYRSMLVSADNAHADHPNHPEYSDPTNKVTLGGGVVIKHHANKNYTSDGLSAAIFAEMMKKAGVKTQNFFMRSDLRCGSTLGTIAVSQLAIRSVDIGAPQLAMHSSLETAAISDCNELVNGLTAFFSGKYEVSREGVKI